MARQDGRRPDGLTLIPWQRGKPLTWDVTVAQTLVDSYVSATARSSGAAAEQAAGRKTAKYDLFAQTSVLAVFSLQSECSTCFNRSQQRRLAR